MSKELTEERKRKPKTVVGVDYWLTDEGLSLLEGWARDGLIDKQIMMNMGIADTTFYKWKKDNPAIDEALRKGKQVVDRQVENALLKTALGYEWEEVTTLTEEVEGKVKKTEKKITRHVPANATAQIFWLKNRKKHEWLEADRALKNTRIKLDS